MDNPGWKAVRKAAQEDHQFEHPHRSANGQFTAVEFVNPINEPFVGEYVPRGAALARLSSPEKQPSPDTSTTQLSQYSSDAFSQTDLSSSLRPSTAVERSRSQWNLAPPRMDPHLQIMCGPLLRYDSVDSKGNYRGACMIVTADAGSVYEPHPSLTLGWDPGQPPPTKRYARHDRFTSTGSISSIGLELSGGISPLATGVPYPLSGIIRNGTSSSSDAQKLSVLGEEIWVYSGVNTTYTFWRFIFEIPLAEVEMSVRYRINQGQEYEFFVPGRDQNMRWATYSCNGFSAGVNPDEFRGPGFSSGYDPLWVDLLDKHMEMPFHVLAGGGDQLYCDGVTREPELQEWITTKDPEEKRILPLTEEIAFAIDRFYFNHYCNVFRTGAFARANSAIPMINMLDDHDIIDGFGSYPANLQTSPIFSCIGSRGYFFFLLFQCFIVPAIDGIDPKRHTHTFKSTIIGGAGAYISYPSHSILTYMGPKIWMLMLDCRAERRKDQVCGPTQYQLVMDALYDLPAGVDHLIVQLGIPIAYPRMNLLESVLESRLNPVIKLGQAGSLGLSSLVNKFNAEAELLDDLNDHWTAKGHKKERNWLVELFQEFAKVKHVRISFLSGDVHCAAVGVFKTLVEGRTSRMLPAADHRYMLNIISSAIVNTPPPGGVLSIVSALAEKRHRSMHYAKTDETMVPLFGKEPDGHGSKSKYIMARRNWCSVEWDEATGELIFDIRVERKQGVGETVSYPIRAPPPRWD